MKLTWMIFGIILGASFTPILIEAQEYFGKFPPTPAWQEIEIANDHTINPLDPVTFTLDARSYSDKMFIVSDGSIIINITQYP